MASDMAMTAMPSDALCAEVEANASRYFNDEIERWARKYERDHLRSIGVRVPFHSLHDYSITGTEIVIAAIEVRRDTLIRLRCDRNWPLADVKLGTGDMYHLAPIFGALRAERDRLARLQKGVAA